MFPRFFLWNVPWKKATYRWSQAVAHYIANNLKKRWSPALLEPANTICLEETFEKCMDWVLTYSPQQADVFIGKAIEYVSDDLQWKCIEASHRMRWFFVDARRHTPHLKLSEYGEQLHYLALSVPSTRSTANPTPCALSIWTNCKDSWISRRSPGSRDPLRAADCGMSSRTQPLLCPCHFLSSTISGAVNALHNTLTPSTTQQFFLCSPNLLLHTLRFSPSFICMPVIMRVPNRTEKPTVTHAFTSSTANLYISSAFLHICKRLQHESVMCVHPFVCSMLIIFDNPANADQTWRDVSWGAAVSSCQKKNPSSPSWLVPATWRENIISKTRCAAATPSLHLTSMVRCNIYEAFHLLDHSKGSSLRRKHERSAVERERSPSHIVDSSSYHDELCIMEGGGGVKERNDP